MIHLSNDILVNCIQRGLRSNWLSDSAKNIAKIQKELTIRKRNWINSFNSSLSIPIPIPFIQFLFNSNSWNWNWYQFQFRNWPQPCTIPKPLEYPPMRKKLATVTSRWPKWSQPALTEPWPGPWLSCDLAVIILKMPWLSCDLAVTELWPRRDWAVTSASRDWAGIIEPRSRDHAPWAHGDHLFSHGLVSPTYSAEILRDCSVL